jgi:hypothetical protein
MLTFIADSLPELLRIRGLLRIALVEIDVHVEAAPTAVTDARGELCVCLALGCGRRIGIRFAVFADLATGKKTRGISI